MESSQELSVDIELTLITGESLFPTFTGCLIC